MCVYHASLPEMETGILYRRSFSCHAAFRFVYGAASNRGIKEHYDSYLPCFAFYPPSVCVLLSYYKDNENWRIYIRAYQNAHAVRGCNTTGGNVPFCSHDSGGMANGKSGAPPEGAGMELAQCFDSTCPYVGVYDGSFLMQCSVVVNEMSAAVMARGFDRDTRRSSYIEVKLSILDWCIITVSAGILAWNLIV